MSLRAVVFPLLLLVEIGSVVVPEPVRALWRNGSSPEFATAMDKRWPDGRAIAAAGFH